MPFPSPGDLSDPGVDPGSSVLDTHKYITTSLIFLTDSMSWWLIIIIAVGSILGMIAINGLIAVICCKVLPKSWFQKDSK